MGDLNPNRANEYLDLVDGGGDLNLSQSGETVSQLHVTQHGNAIMGQFNDCAVVQLSAVTDNAVLNTSPGTTALEMRMVPEGTVRVPISVKLEAVPDGSGTAQSATGTTIVLDAGDNATDDFYNGGLIVITGGTGAGQSRSPTDYVGASKTATVPTWNVIPDATSTYEAFQAGNEDKWVNTTCLVSNPGTSVISYTIEPPNASWLDPVEAQPLPNLDVNTSQVKHMALAQDSRDYWTV
jgi:hypothetical protein